MECLGSHVQISITFNLSAIFIFPQNHNIENIGFPLKRTTYFFPQWEFLIFWHKYMEKYIYSWMIPRGKIFDSLVQLIVINLKCKF